MYWYRQNRGEALRDFGREEFVTKKPRSAIAKKPEGAPSDSATTEVVVFEYIKSTAFRVIHADGAIGGISPSGNIHFALFSDRPAIPRLQVNERNADGTLGRVKPEHTVVRPGIIREMDVDVVMSPVAAKALADWLIQNLSKLEEKSKK